MNILYAVHGYKPAYRMGGPIISVSSAAEMLVRKGHRVIVFTTNSNLDEDLDVPLDEPVMVDGVEVWYFRREEPIKKWLPFIPYLSRSIGFLYCPAMRSALDRVVPLIDVVDTHMPFVYPTYAAAHAAFRHEKPLFYHQRGTFNPGGLRFRGGKKKLYIAAIERPIMRRATTLIALTEAERESFRELDVQTPVEIVPNGIDIPPLRLDAEARVQARFGIAAGAPVVLFLGRLHPTKGAERLLDVFTRVTAQNRDVMLVMAGPDEWRLEEQCRATMERGGSANQVIFAGMLTGDDKADVLARADLFALPSIGEGFSMAVLEALASSTAVMLSPGCNFPEVEAAGAGVVIDTDPAAMADVMMRLLSDRDELRAMGARGRRLVAERYSWDVIADQLIEVYERGVHQHR
jgi:glycosyltransferase involved in cell wall biosynthesis